jgi:ankyrin repeat protein
MLRLTHNNHVSFLYAWFEQFRVLWPCRRFSYAKSVRRRSGSVEDTRKFHFPRLPRTTIEAAVLIGNRQHKKTHTKPQICASCSKRFASRTDLTRHVNNVHRVGQKTFRCVIGDCGHRSKRKDNLAKHIGMYHSNYAKRALGHVQPDQGGNTSSADEADKSKLWGSTEDTLRSLEAALMHATNIGNASQVTSILDTGIDPNAIADDGYTALHCAAKTGQVEIMRLLLDNGATVDPCNARTKWRRPIHEAVSAKHSAAFAILLEAGADLWKPDGQRHTVLEQIGSTGYIPVAQLLIHAEPERMEISELVPPMALSSVKSGKGSFFSWLLTRVPEALSPSSTLWRSCMSLAARRGHQEIFELLLSKVTAIPLFNEEEVRSCLSGCLRNAARLGVADVVQVLVGIEVIDVNERSSEWKFSALFHAAQRGDLRNVRILLGHSNINVNTMDWAKTTPLHVAAQHGHVEIIQLLLGHKDIDARHKDDYDSTASSLAFFNYRWNTLRLLLRYLKKKTALTFGFTEGKLPTTNTNQFILLAKYLLEHELLSIQKSGWHGLLQSAVKASALTLIKSLLAHIPLDINMVLCGTRTVLHLAAEYHRHEIFMLYLDQPNIDVNIRQIKYWSMQDSVMHHAVRHNCITAVKLLLVRPEIDLTLCNRERDTALDVAQKLGRHEMFELLVQRGAIGKSVVWDITIEDTTFDRKSCCRTEEKGIDSSSNIDMTTTGIKEPEEVDSDAESEDEDMLDEADGK